MGESSRWRRGELHTFGIQGLPHRQRRSGRVTGITVAVVAFGLASSGECWTRRSGLHDMTTKAPAVADHDHRVACQMEHICCLANGKLNPQNVNSNALFRLHECRKGRSGTSRCPAPVPFGPLRKLVRPRSRKPAGLPPCRRNAIWRSYKHL